LREEAFRLAEVAFFGTDLFPFPGQFDPAWKPMQSKPASSFRHPF
jgi:hypothetical protein